MTVLQFRKYWLSSLWTSAILFATLLPGDKIPQSKILEFNLADKYIHLLLFSILFLLIVFDTYRSKKTVLSIHFRYAWLIGIGLAVLTEGLQMLVIVSRSGNVFDLVANILGCFIGYGLSKIFLKYKAV